MKFPTAEQALRWAYETQAKGNSTACSSLGAGRCPTSLDDRVNDKLMQAQSILFMCERELTTLHAAYIKVQFGREVEGMETLNSYVRNFDNLKGVKRRSIDVIICAYCGERIGMQAMRRSLNCGMLKATNIRNSVYEILDGVHTDAMDTVYSLLHNKGLMLKVIK